MQTPVQWSIGSRINADTGKTGCWGRDIGLCNALRCGSQLTVYRIARCLPDRTPELSCYVGGASFQMKSRSSWGGLLPRIMSICMCFSRLCFPGFLSSLFLSRGSEGKPMSRNVTDGTSRHLSRIGNFPLACLPLLCKASETLAFYEEK